MTATITTVQQALKTAIDAMTLPLLFVSRIQEADSAEIPDVGADVDIVIGFESSSRLARTGSTILDQLLVPVTVRRRYDSGLQSDLDACHDFTEKLRDGLAAFHSGTSRVEQLLSPHPFDAPQASGPGMFASKFVLDMDALRTPTTIVQDVTTPLTIMTKIRQAVWAALNGWSEWNGSTWARKYQTDADFDELALHDPGEFDLPALAVTWGPTNPRFFVHTAQEWPVTVSVVAWFPIHQTTLAEYRAQQIVRCIYQGGNPATPGVSYVRAATGRLPEKDAPITLDAVEIGRSQQLKALKLVCNFTLTGVVSPLTD